MNDRNMTPYASAARSYWEAGWANPIPVRGKYPPVSGYTGAQGHNVSFPDLTAWCDGPEAGWNIALRLPPTVIGVDVDSYDGKIGGQTIAKAEADLGSLPATWTTTSRVDGSGIKLFRVPGDVDLHEAEGILERSYGQEVDGTRVSHVEIIRHGHRYAMVWPSVHPGTGVLYRWYRPDGGQVGDVDPLPRPADIPELPEAWIQALTTREGPASSSDDFTQPDAPDDARHEGVIPHGKRHRELVSYASRLRNLASRHDGRVAYLRYDEAEIIYRRRWEDCAQPPDAPYPVTWEDARSKLADVFKRYPAGEAPPAEAGEKGSDEPEWPTLDRAAYYGLPGLVADNLDAYTEADPAAVLVLFLAEAGALIGSRPHVFAGDVEHPARLWPLIVGKTSGGMKGTAGNAVRRIRKDADSLYDAGNVAGGLSSGEGLIERVRDPSGDPEDEDKYDPGVEDKRLLVVESEFGSVLAQTKRETNTLSQIMRQAWDGTRLQTMTRKKNSLVSTDPHIVITAHVTPQELRAKLAESDLAGGLVNRFLPVCSRRSKRLPSGGGAPNEMVSDLGAQLRKAASEARTVWRVRRTESAERLWEQVYEELTPDDVPEGPVAMVVARAVPQVLRLSLTYALLDHSKEVDVPHLEAALAVWRYIQASAYYVFGDSTGNPDLDKLLTFVRQSGQEGVTRDDVHQVCFSKHKSRKQLDELLSRMLSGDDYEQVQEDTGGRPVTRYKMRDKRDKREKGSSQEG